jgi:hypothetical protein
MFRSSVRRLALDHRQSSLSFSHRHSLSSPKISIQRLYSTPTTARCPSCSQPLPTPLPACPNCAYISAVPSSNPYHQIFGLTYDPNPFIVDVSLLKRRFRQAQAICHPDAWASQGPVSFALFSPVHTHRYQGKARSGTDTFLANKSCIPSPTFPVISCRIYSRAQWV